MIASMARIGFTQRFFSNAGQGDVADRGGAVPQRTKTGAAALRGAQ
jgi:hypothetical protein